jgi:hypothetical protein
MGNYGEFCPIMSNNGESLLQHVVTSHSETDKIDTPKEILDTPKEKTITPKVTTVLTI